jgi:hypothetical protein
MEMNHGNLKTNLKVSDQPFKVPPEEFVFGYSTYHLMIYSLFLEIQLVNIFF